MSDLDPPSSSHSPASAAATPAPRVPVVEAPEPPEVARVVFGDRLGLASGYAQLLAGDAVVRGALGPRETPRLWQRHLLNSALLADLLPRGAHVVDIGSGAGLPGIPLAIRRPDLHVRLVEPMLRRTLFLESVVERLALNDVEIIRGRAEDPSVRAAAGGSGWVVARAVAPLDRLVEWCLPLLAGDGRLLALKGEQAGAEMSAAAPRLRRLGAAEPVLRRIGAGLPVDPTWVVDVRRANRMQVTPAQSKRGGRHA